MNRETESWDSGSTSGNDTAGRESRRSPRIPTWLGLLIIVAVAAGIIVPRLITRPRPQVSRVRTDMRSLATALEAYFGDHQAYPAMTPLRDLDGINGARLKKAGGWELATVDTGNTTHAGLTTPLAYINSLFPDAHAPDKHIPYAYYTDGAGWILLSPGPDGDYDIEPERDYTSSIPQPSEHLLAIAGTYDPTNGTNSDGDLWRVHQ